MQVREILRRLIERPRSSIILTREAILRCSKRSVLQQKHCVILKRGSCMINMAKTVWTTAAVVKAIHLRIFSQCSLVVVEEGVDVRRVRKREKVISKLAI